MTIRLTQRYLGYLLNSLIESCSDVGVGDGGGCRHRDKGSAEEGRGDRYPGGTRLVVL